MFQDSILTSFGAALTLRPTTFIYLPQTGDGTTQALPHADASPVLQLHVPQPLLKDGATQGPNLVRLGCLNGVGSRIGVAMAYNGGHFAMGVYDHGDPQAQEMMQATLKSGRARLMLRADTDSTLVVARVTDPMRRVLADCLGAAPSSFGDFAETIGGVSNALCASDIYREMGLDPRELRTVTLSVCMPRSGTSSELLVTPLASVH